MIPDEAVEAAARALVPKAWGPQVWTFMAHGETPTEARDRVQRESLEAARRALEAAAPHLMAAAWDEAVEAYKAWTWDDGNIDPFTNPYRKPHDA